MSSNPVSQSDLASALAARLCHDFVGPAGSAVAGLDILAASPAEDMRGAAMEMIDDSARRLLALIVFSRVAYGAGDEVFDAGALETLARGVFAGLRPTLEWAVEAPALGGAAARTLLNLVQIAADALAVGGVARAWAEVRDGKTCLGVDATGPRARLHPEVLAGLSGEARGEGPRGRWAQARFVHAIVGPVGGEVGARTGEDEITFWAIFP